MLLYDVIQVSDKSSAPTSTPTQQRTRTLKNVDSELKHSQGLTKCAKLPVSVAAEL